MNQDLRDALPAKGYLAEYVAYASAVSMAPPEFHLACGLAQLSAILGNRETFVLGEKHYPPHLWLVLLGRAGAKKSSAISLAMHMLDEATDSAHRLPKEVTREALWDVLAANPEGYLELSEFTSFLAAASREYMRGLKEDLCEIFDSPALLTRKLRSQKIEIKDPTITIIAAAVVDALGDWTRTMDFSQGFMSRFLFVPQTSRPSYIGMLGASHPARSSLVDTLRRMNAEVTRHQARVRIVFADDARRVWEDYDREQLDRTVPRELSGFASRLGLYVAKLSLCYALSEFRTDPDPEDVWHAIAFAEYCREQVWRLVVDDFDSGRDAQDLRRVRRYIEEHGGDHPQGWIPLRQVYRALHMLRARVDQLLATLEASGEAETQVRRCEGAKPSTEVRTPVEADDAPEPDDDVYVTRGDTAGQRTGRSGDREGQMAQTSR